MLLIKKKKILMINELINMFSQKKIEKVIYSREETISRNASEYWKFVG